MCIQMCATPTRNANFHLNFCTFILDSFLFPDHWKPLTQHALQKLAGDQTFPSTCWSPICYLNNIQPPVSIYQRWSVLAPVPKLLFQCFPFRDSTSKHRCCKMLDASFYNHQHPAYVLFSKWMGEISEWLGEHNCYLVYMNPNAHA